MLDLIPFDIKIFCTSLAYSSVSDVIVATTACSGESQKGDDPHSVQ